MYHLKGSPAAESALRVAIHGLVGQQMQRSNDGGKTWSLWGTNSSTTVSRTHQWYDGTPHPWEFKRVWQPGAFSHRIPMLCTAASRMRRCSAHEDGQQLARATGTEGHGSGSQWATRAEACVSTQSCSIPPTTSACSSRFPPRVHFRTDDRSQDVRPDQPGSPVGAHS